MSSIWQKTAKLPKFSSLSGNAKTDVLIIGGGIAGILTAYRLEQQGIEYMLVEKNRILSGTTAGTTAKLTYQHGLIYDKLIKTCGMETAKGYYQANKEAFEALKALAAAVDCDYEEKDNFIYTTNSPKKLESELAAMEKIGCPARLVRNLPIPIYTEGGISVPNQGQFNPIKLLGELAKGLNIYENTFVREVKGRQAVTANGIIRAEKIIVLTHFPFINTHGSYFLKLYQHRTYMIALENAQDVGGMYVDEDKSGLTWRNYGSYLIIGGCSHRTGKPSKGYAPLESLARAKYPEAKIAAKWAAQDCISLDGMPYIGRYSQNTSGLYTAAGFNKWGMTGSMLSAMMLSDMVLGVKNSRSRLFSPSRSILRPQLFLNGMETAVSMLTPTAHRCPHLGCALKWNPYEHSWDCPCHGSRLKPDGKVLDNPANKK